MYTYICVHIYIYIYIGHAVVPQGHGGDLRQAQGVGDGRRDLQYSIVIVLVIV